MLWQDELITSKSEAMDYLKKHFEGSNPWLFPVHDGAKNLAHAFAPRVGVPYDVQKNAPFALYFNLSQTESYALLDGYYIGEEFRQKGFGLVGLKAVFGAAYEFGADTVRHSYISDDGPGFWPMLGALPTEDPKFFALDMNEVIQEQVPKVKDSKNKILLERISDLSEKNPIFAWRALATLNIANDIKRHIFTQLCVEGDLQTIPGEPGTRQMLSYWLGVIPPFRPPTKGYVYQQIRQALGDKAAAAHLRMAL